MENLLRDISNVVVYLDDILVSGSTEAEHLHTLDRVMSHLEEHGLHLKLSNCVFMAPSVEYLGHHISADGITAPQHLVCRAVQSLHINRMQTGIIEVFICRRLHMDTSTILICIWLVCRLYNSAY